MSQLGRLDAVLAEFDTNIRRTQELINFDSEILGFLNETVTHYANGLSHKPSQQGALNFISAIAATIKNTRKEDKLKASYQTIYNQCLVLLVSHFTAALTEVFKRSIILTLKAGIATELLNSKIEIRVDELLKLDPSENEDSLAQLLVEHVNESFQDMQSTRRAFEGTLPCKLERDSTMDNIILAQASRHLIVHTGGIVNLKFHHQLRGTRLRTLKTILPKTGDTIQFSPDEIDEVAREMSSFLKTLIDQVGSAVTSQEVVQS